MASVCRKARGTEGARLRIPRLLLVCVVLLSAWLTLVGSAVGECVNQGLRMGPSAALPDCRAYELVSPPDTNGRRIGAIRTFGQPGTHELFATELFSPSRDSFVYLAYSSPLLSPGGATGIVDVYEAERGPLGWATNRRISPPGLEAEQAVPGGVSSDHLYALTNVSGSTSSLSLGGPTDYIANPDGSYELTGQGSMATEPFAQGRWISEAGSHVIFSTGFGKFTQSAWCGSACQVKQLEPDAPPTGTGAIYDRGADGPTHVVSLLPGNVTPSAGQQAFYKGASKDGTAVAFAIGGTLYARLDNNSTVEVAGGSPTYGGLSEDGDYLFYVAGGNIHRFNTGTEADEQINSTGDGQLDNLSGDGSHIYFISNSQIGGEGTAGQPNLYVWSDSSVDFIATVLPSDLERTSGELEGFPGLAHWTTWVMNEPPNHGEPGPAAEASRTTPDGTVFVFESRAKLTGYENAGHTEIYRYDDEEQSLACVSCNPLAEPAIADARLQELYLTGSPTVIHNVSDDGGRIFFETEEALVAGDKGGVNDIYEWHEEMGGVAVDLISSGQSSEYQLPPEAPRTTTPFPNILLSVTPDGDDVVFLSQDVLVPGAGEGGTAAIYDARVGGGFPVPPPPSICFEEGCRQPGSSTPALEAPRSEQITGRGNVKPRKHRRCRRGKHRKHRRCQRGKHRNGALRSVASGNPTAVIAEQAPDSSVAHTEEGAGERQQTSASAPISFAGPYDEFGIESVGAATSTPKAAMHPDFTTEISFNHFINEGNGAPESRAKTEEIQVELPPGLLGNPTALPRCSTGLLVAYGNCPVDSQVGVVKVNTTLVGEGRFPLFSLEPPHPDREIARFGFFLAGYSVFIDVRVRTAGDYGATATVHSSPGLTALLEAETTLWGNPPDHSHDELRMTTVEAEQCNFKVGSETILATACKAPGGKRESGLPPTAFMTNPSACQEQDVRFSARSYQLPGQIFKAAASMAPIVDCQGLPFAPTFDAQPTTRVAGAPTGLHTILQIPQSQDPTLPGTATMREARVTLPPGMTIAAGAADGLEACTDQQVGYHQEAEAACPDASKLGTIEITSPDLSVPLKGSIYQRTPRPGHLFGLWLVVDQLGLHIKLPGEIEPDKETGELTAVFSNLPQVPVEEIQLSVWGGPRGPLKNPDSCGTYATSFAFAPHSQDPPVTGQSQMTIDEACEPHRFSPGLRAGVTQPVAGSFSPFVLELRRDDGEENLARFDVTLPKGELAKLAGVPLCPEAAASTGACPTASKIGSVTAAVGPGSQPLWIPQPGKAPTAIYLSGPYRGAPYSVVTVVPAQAGPFDLGTVTVRAALRVDPETAQATIETDPLPQFIEGVPLIYRRLHAVIDRPGFSLNPTNCAELAVDSAIASIGGTVAHPSDRFQVDGCAGLKFGPKLSLELKGGTNRGDYPGLTAVLKPRKGDANLRRASVALPHSEFLAQEHIVTICTRLQFAADRCPKGSVYGSAKALTPLLDEPLAGRVYLRSSDHPLPDLVVALRGQISIDLVGRIDSKNGGIRTTFNPVPDAPVTKFVLRMKGGKKSLLINSEDLCHGRHRAIVRMAGQNGRIQSSRPPLKTKCDQVP
jgi:hypothetical protein